MKTFLSLTPDPFTLDLLDRQPVAAFPTTTGERAPAIGGAHALTKPVHFPSAVFLRLVRSLRHIRFEVSDCFVQCVVVTRRGS